MSKPQPKRIPSDSCPVRVDGAVCYPHEGEWVELIALETVGELRARCRMAGLGAELEKTHGEPDEAYQFNVLMDAHYAELCDYLAERVFAWSWTDLRGIPLPPPADEEGKPLGLLKLRAGELYWLLNATGAETEAERKNE